MNPPPRTFAGLCAAHGLTPDPACTRLLVAKSRRRLTLFHGETCLVVIPVIVGRQPVGTKLREGDEHTPEGTYHICYRNAQSRFHRFLGLDYPNRDDAARALAAGLIDQAQHDRLVATITAGRPDWYTPLGGEIGIHGGGTDRLGTAGCVAMADTDIDLIWEATQIGTPVRIEP